jgi:hypothetical protein
LAAQLEALASAGDAFEARARVLTEKWTANGVGFEAVEPILRFMEAHGSIDFGSPGPLVHFVETFNGVAYVQALTTSLDRKPTQHTAWMMNRVLNGARTPSARRALVDAMSRARSHPDADAETIATLDRFLEHQRDAGR